MTNAPQTLSWDAPGVDTGSHRRLRQDGAADEATGAELAADAEWLSLDALAGFVDQWQTLALRAVEPNVFYEPAFALSAARAFGASVRAIAIWSDARRERLIALFPCQIARRWFGLGPSLLLGWTHPFAPLGTPLIDREHGADAVSAVFAFMADQPGMPRLVLLSYTATQGPVAALMRQAVEQRGGRATFLGRHARALLASPEDRAGYLAQALSAKKRKELRRQQRLLGGDIRLAITTGERDVETSLDAFLALEREGWKGRQGTAAAQDAVIEQFMRDAVIRLALRGQAQVVALMADGRTVASGIVLRSGDRAWFWKIAYDESVARASPGVQLTAELTRALLDDASVQATDSCATANHAMIDHIWRERLDVGDMLLAADRRASGAFVYAQSLDHAHRRIIATAKALRATLRRR